MRSRSLMLCLLALVSMAMSALALEETAGEPWEGGEAVRSSTAMIMFEEHARAPEIRELRRKPYFFRQFDRLAANPDSPRVSTWPPENADLTPRDNAVQTVGVNFTGATLADTHAFPPDSMGAAGPAQFIVAVNGRLRTFTKTGTADGVLDVDTDVFFAPVMTPPLTNNFTSDPRIRYDRLSRRWFIVMIDVPGKAGVLPNRIMIAASDGPIVRTNTVWSFFQFRQDQVSASGDANEFADYPTLGIDANALYIGVNLFGTRGQGTFDNTTAFVVRKSSLLSGGPIVVTAFRQLVGHGTSGGPYTPQGVDNYDPAATEGYVIGVDAAFYGRLDLRRITNPGGTPSISGNIQITVPLNGATMTVPHLGNTAGTGGNLDGLDYRLMAAHLRNGRLWTCENIAVNNAGAPDGTDTRNGVRWYELQGIATGQTPSVVQSGTLFQPSAANTADQRHYWMGTIMVSGQGHAAMGFSVAGANEHINAGTAGRLAKDPLGTMQTPVLYTASTTAYNPARDPGGSFGRRWGDYSYTSLDPNDDMTMWTIQEFCDATDSYGVQVVQLLAPPPATPVSCSPSSIAAGSSNVSVTVTGLVVNGSGFFDPGPGFSNRIAAAVSGGGVSVDSVAYVNPTNLVLHLSVAASAASASRTITVINPDGQSITSASNLLTITRNVVSNRPPVLATIADKTVNEASLLAFNANAADPDGDTLTFDFVGVVPAGASINPTNGAFTWTPNETQGPGTNMITVRVTDNGVPPLSDTKTFSIVVSEVNLAPLLAAISNRTVYAGETVNFTATATDNDIPTNVLHFALEPGAPAGAMITDTGLFSWTTSDSDVGSHTIGVRVTDDGVPPLSDTTTVELAVAAAPRIESITFVQTNVTVRWTAIAGWRYRLQFKTDLDSAMWSDVSGDVTATGSLAEQSDVVADSQRFYRVAVLP